MIKFIEKERYYDDSPYTGSCYYYLTYMVKDEKEFFVFNRRDPNDEWKIKEDEKRKNQLIENVSKIYSTVGTIGIYACGVSRLRGRRSKKPRSL